MVASEFLPLSFDYPLPVVKPATAFYTIELRNDGDLPVVWSLSSAPSWVKIVGSGDSRSSRILEGDGKLLKLTAEITTVALKTGDVASGSIDITIDQLFLQESSRGTGKTAKTVLISVPLFVKASSPSLLVSPQVVEDRGMTGQRDVKGTSVFVFNVESKTSAFSTLVTDTTVYEDEALKPRENWVKPSLESAELESRFSCAAPRNGKCLPAETQNEEKTFTEIEISYSTLDLLPRPEPYTASLVLFGGGNSVTILVSLLVEASFANLEKFTANWVLDSTDPSTGALVTVATPASSTSEISPTPEFVITPRDTFEVATETASDGAELDTLTLYLTWRGPITKDAANNSIFKDEGGAQLSFVDGKYAWEDVSALPSAGLYNFSLTLGVAPLGGGLGMFSKLFTPESCPADQFKEPTPGTGKGCICMLGFEVDGLGCRPCAPGFVQLVQGSPCTPCQLGWCSRKLLKANVNGAVHTLKSLMLHATDASYANPMKLSRKLILHGHVLHVHKVYKLSAMSAFVGQNFSKT